MRTLSTETQDALALTLTLTLTLALTLTIIPNPNPNPNPNPSPSPNPNPAGALHAGLHGAHLVAPRAHLLRRRPVHRVRLKGLRRLHAHALY